MQWHLVGHSMGANTLVALYPKLPQQIASLNFVAGAVYNNEPSGFLWLLNFPPLQRWISVALEYFVVNKENIGNFLSSAYGRAPSDQEIEGYLSPLILPGTSLSAVQLLRTTQNVDIAILASSGSKIKMNAIWGANDTWVPVGVLSRLRGDFPDLNGVIINGASHCPMETHSQQFNENLLSMITK
jgi:pimeloyl-ACP methyl ester carboxylesterase